MPDYGRFQNIVVTVEDGVATVRLNRPDALNAIAVEMHNELEDAFADLGRDRGVRAIVVTGAGRAFSAGGDIRRMQARLEKPALDWIPVAYGRRLILNILEVEQPIIAAVNGDAFGLGATLALFCDVTIMAETARIADTHVRVGIVAGDGGAIIWPFLIGINKAKELLMTGDILSAKEAERIGLVNRVVAPEEVLPQANALARRLADGPVWAVRWTKASVNKFLRDRMNLILDTSLAYESLSMVSEDHKEALKAFLERRKPEYKGH